MSLLSTIKRNVHIHQVMWSDINTHWHVCVHPCQGGLDQRGTWTLYVYNTMLKGSFHNGPRWGWDDGYGLSLGVSAAGLGPLWVYGIRSSAICQHWVGTDPWPGPGAVHTRTTFTNLTLGARWGGQQNTHVLNRRTVHLHLTTCFCSHLMIS